MTADRGLRPELSRLLERTVQSTERNKIEFTLHIRTTVVQYFVLPVTQQVQVNGAATFRLAEEMQRFRRRRHARIFILIRRFVFVDPTPPPLQVGALSHETEVEMG